MAICLNCGTILHEEDSEKHKCKIDKIPKKGKEFIPTTTEEIRK